MPPSQDGHPAPPGAAVEHMEVELNCLHDTSHHIPWPHPGAAAPEGPGGAACAVTHTHVHTGEDVEGLPVLSHTHMYTQARTWKDCLCCHKQTHVHMIEDLEGPHVLSHTHMYTQART